MAEKWDERLVRGAKQTAEQVVREAQSALAQGQQAIDEWQVRRDAQRLLTDLGVAYFAEQRHGGDHADVERAMARLDDHAARYGSVGPLRSDGPTTPPP